MSLLIAALLAIVPACASTTTSSQTWTAQAPPAAWAKPGRVESITEIVQRTEGHPGGGALAGALIGGFLFGHHGHPSLFGAAAGAAVGAAASQGRAETRTYQVLVHFHDGTYGVFVYAAFPPFQPGQQVVLTQQGLAPS